MAKMTINVVLRSDRAIMIAAIGIISVWAWAYILWLAAQTTTMAVPAPDGAGMAEMNMPGMTTSPGTMSGGVSDAAWPAFRPWGIADFAFVFAMWAVMMVGMMTPSVAPMVLLYATVGRKAAASGRPLAATGWFLGGYLSAWIAFSLAATGMQWVLTRLALLTPMMESASGIFGGFVLMMAGLYQWSPLKDMCLKQCQTPLGFLMGRGGFRSEPFGALQLGAEHGLYCVGCCWVLMALLFVGGVMNVLWIAGIALLVLLEKVVPTGRLIPRLSGAGLIAAGLLLLVGLV